MASKVCSKCQVTKPTYEFNHDSYAADGFHHKCKQCNVEVMKQWKENNRDRMNEQMRNRYANNPQVRINLYMHVGLFNTLKKGI